MFGQEEEFEIYGFFPSLKVSNLKPDDIELLNLNVSLDPDIKVLSRSVYTFLDFAGDIGGL